MPDERAEDPPVFPGCRAIVTGAEPARALAAGLAASGARVRTVGPGGDVACRFSSRAEIGAALTRAAAGLGGLDLLVHAWIPDVALESAPLATLAEDRWIAACEDTLEAAFRVTQEAHGLMRAAGGTLVHIVTTLATIGGQGFAPLAAAQEGIHGLVKSAGRAWGPDGIRVHALALAPQVLVEREAGDQLARTVTLGPPALGRYGDLANDIAPIAALLATPAAHFATGTTLTLDGGVWNVL